MAQIRDEAAWRKAWLDVTKPIPHDVTYQESAEHLRRLIRSKLLLYSDAQAQPDRFFEAHRLLVGLESPGFSMYALAQSSKGSSYMN
jgi:hypothetical protein